MDNSFGALIKKLRTESQLSQQDLADKAFVSRCGVANWESGRRVPDLVIMSRKAKALNVDVSVFTNSLDASDTQADIIVLDDERILLQGAISVLEETLPGVNITGFTKPSEALAYVESNDVGIIFLDIELGNENGLDLCKQFLRLNPLVNIIFLTSHSDYALDAWKTGASGYLLKPLHAEDIKKQLSSLRHPIQGMSFI